MPRLPKNVSLLIEKLATEIPTILGRNLVGIYPYGSVTNSSFNPERSDVDCIVVTRRDVSEPQFRKLKQLFEQTEKSNSWATRLQIIFLIKGQLLKMNARACHYQFGLFRRGRSDGNPIIWLDYLRNRKIVFGPSVDTFLPEITPRTFLRALRRELHYLREEISLKPKSEWRDVPMYRAFAVLTICRVLYSFDKGTIVSKPAAAEWAMRTLPERWSGIINRALDFNENGQESEIPLRRIEQFLTFAESKLIGANA